MGDYWLPVEENTHEPINQTLKADGSVEDNLVSQGLYHCVF